MLPLENQLQLGLDGIKIRVKLVDVHPLLLSHNYQANQFLPEALYHYMGTISI